MNFVALPFYLQLYSGAVATLLLSQALLAKSLRKVNLPLGKSPRGLSSFFFALSAEARACYPRLVLFASFRLANTKVPA